MATRGENLVRVKFNPNDRSDLQLVKSRIAAVIDLVNNIRPDLHGAECARHKAIAIHDLETAAMYAEKALTGRGAQ